MTKTILGRLVNPNDVGDDILLLIGQSNTVGIGEGGDTTYLDPPNPRIRQWAGVGSTYAGQSIAAIDPLFHVNQQQAISAGIGFGMTLAREYLRTIPTNRNVLLIPAARGSTSFYKQTTGQGGMYTWDRSVTDPTFFNLYNNAVAQTQAALAANPNNRLRAIFWIQGESDTPYQTQSQYATLLDALIAGLRSTFGVSIPFVVGQMNPDQIATGATGYAGINAAHLDTPRRNLRTAFAYGTAGSYNSSTNGGTLHYNAAGQRAMGRALLDQLLRFVPANITGTMPTVPGTPTISQSGTTLTLNWVRTPGRATDYNVRTSTDGGTTWTTLTRAQSIDATATITGATLGSTTQVQVRTVNDQGISAWSSSGSLTLASIPAQVTGLSAGTPTGTACVVSWTAVTGASNYLVEYKLHSGSTWSTSGTSTTPSLSVGGLANATQYDVRVTAQNAAGSGTASATASFTTQAASPLMTDVGVSAHRALGVRKLVSAATQAILVRRSSDSTTQAIGFAANGDLDTTSLLSFVGAGDGFVVTIYDQSGNGRNVTAPSTGAQGKIISAGAVVTGINGKPTITFDGTATQYVDSTTGGSLWTGGALTAATVLKSSIGNTLETIFGEASATAYGRVGWFSYNSQGLFTGYNDANTQIENSGSTVTTISAGTPRQLTLVDSGTSVQQRIAGTQESSASYTRTGTITQPTRFVLGAGGAGAPTTPSTTNIQFYSGNIAEFIAWSSALTTTQQQAAEANQRNYWNV